MKKSNIHKIHLEPVVAADHQTFIKILQESFQIAVNETFGSLDGGPIPPDEDIEESLNAPEAESYHFVLGQERVGGVVLSINRGTHQNVVCFLFLMPKYIGLGIGTVAWKAIEDQYPETVSWSLVTPYFEKRNIHYYVNKCGFHIIEYYNAHHPDPYWKPDSEEASPPFPGEEDFFKFEKVMKLR